MTKLLLRLFICLGVFAPSLRAESMAPELLDLLNEDPSLLLDPGTQIAEPPAPSLPAEPEREPSSSGPSEVPKQEEKKSETPKTSSEEVIQVSSIPEPAQPAQPEEKEDFEPAQGELYVSFTIATPQQADPPEASPPPSVTAMETGELQVSFTITPNPSIEVTPEPVVAPPSPINLRSELEALPGVGDHAIILDGNQFFPATIKMRSGSKGRLLFITTNQKPAALVFVRPSIQRWVSSEDRLSQPQKPLEEFREFSAEKIAQIPFDAEPGTYEFYDALSGAKGEIKVE